MQVLIGALAISGAGLLLWWSFFSDRKADRAKATLGDHAAVESSRSSS